MCLLHTSFFLPDSDTCGVGEWCFVVITLVILVTMVGELVSVLFVPVGDCSGLDDGGIGAC